jgi:hypothetical protein
VKKTKKAVKGKWWATCWAPDYEIMVHPNSESALGFIEDNGAQLLAQIEVPMRTHLKLKKDFKNKELCAVGVSWERYSKDFAHVCSVNE